MPDAARRRATYEDVLAAPEHMIAELIGGDLYLQPRPALPHAAAASALSDELGPPFKRGRGGPGGWIILYEPELHLGGDVLVPDLGGWRRTTMQSVPNAPYLEIRPDWVCEVLSPSTEKTDRAVKLPIYAHAQVAHAWLVNPLLHTLEVLALERGRWTTLHTFRDDQKVRAEPFDAIELDLSVLWADVQL